MCSKLMCVYIQTFSQENQLLNVYISGSGPLCLSLKEIIIWQDPGKTPVVQAPG